MLSGASSFTQQVDKIFIGILAISVFFLILITFFMIFFVVKYHRKKHASPQNISGNTLLEIIWTAIPTLLVLGMFYYGWVSYSVMRKVPEGAETIKVIGRMWAWEFEYQNGRKSDTLYVPLNVPIKLELASRDVIHSFYVPAFRIKQDVVPGLTNSVWFQPKIAGSFDILCAEYCGLQHSYMLAVVTVLSQEKFKQWYGGPLSTPVPGKEGGSTTNLEIQRGKQLAAAKGCISCHTTDGSKSVGPTFLGIYGTKIVVKTAGKERRVLIDETYLRNSILNPGADITKGFQPLMPRVKNQVTEEQIDDLITFIKNLK